MTGSGMGLFCLGVLVGFLAAWLWDWAFWRRPHDSAPPARDAWAPGTRGPAGQVTGAIAGAAEGGER